MPNSKAGGGGPMKHEAMLRTWLGPLLDRKVLIVKSAKTFSFSDFVFERSFIQQDHMKQISASPNAWAHIHKEKLSKNSSAAAADSWAPTVCYISGNNKSLQRDLITFVCVVV